MPQRMLSWEGHHLRVVVPEQEGYVFKGWNHSAVALKSGNFQEIVVIVPANEGSDTVPRYVAVFEVANTEAPTSAPSLPPVTDPTVPSPNSSVASNLPIDDDKIDFGGDNSGSMAESASLALFVSFLCYLFI